MNNFDRLNEVIKYIEDNLTYEISIEKICQILCVNEYSLYRIFNFITGISLTEYIRNRKLSMAGLELINSKIKIIDLSLKYGYDSPISFSRAFKKFHGIKPSEVKQNSKYLKNFAPFTFTNNTSNNIELDFKIQKKDKLHFYTIPKSTWAIFNVKEISGEAMSNLSFYVYKNWIPYSGYNIKNIPEIEVYYKNHTEWWLPIEKNYKI